MAHCPPEVADRGHRPRSGPSSRPCPEEAKATEPPAEATAIREEATLPRIPLGLVLSVCPEIQAFANEKLRHWHHLVRAAEVVRPMMGISGAAWDEAKAAMGPEQAAVVLAAMLERFAEIRSPGGYLRNLTAKSDAGAFSCGPMVMALMRRAA
ncbi:MAG: plasmid replication protein RepC [Paracoccus sp. (in: a-proteobacteria)]